MQIAKNRSLTNIPAGWLLLLGILILVGCKAGEEPDSGAQSDQTPGRINSEEIERDIGIPGRQSSGTYKLFADFSANRGEIVLQNDSVFIYSALTDMDGVYNSNLMSDNASGVSNIHHLSVYHWEETRFVPIREDTVSFQPMATEAIDRDNSVDLSIRDVAAQRAIAEIRDEILIKHQETADLNGDGVPEYLLVYSRARTGEFGYFYGIIILEQSRNRYTIAYQYISDFQSYVGDLVLRDLTGDTQPEIILYELDFGASGYTAYAQVFGVDRSQDYASYGDE